MVALLFTFPAAVMAILLGGEINLRRIATRWAEAAALMAGFGLTVFFWDLFEGSASVFLTLFEAPNKLYTTFYRTVETLLYIGLFVPKYVIQTKSLLYYLCLETYALGIVLLFQPSVTGRNLLLALTLTLLPAAILVEYYLPTYLSHLVSAYTSAKIQIPIRDYTYTLSKYAISCGIINWTLLFGMLLTVNLICGFGKRR